MTVKKKPVVKGKAGTSSGKCLLKHFLLMVRMRRKLLWQQGLARKRVALQVQKCLKTLEFC